MNVKTIALNKSRCKKGKPLDVIPVVMSEKHISFSGHLFEEVLAQSLQAGAAVKDEAFTSQTHLYTRSVATVAHGVLTWGWNTASDAPELHKKLGGRTVSHVELDSFTRENYIVAVLRVIKILLVWKISP